MTALKVFLLLAFIAADIAVGIWIYDYATANVARKQQAEQARAQAALCAQTHSAHVPDPRLGETAESAQIGRLNCPPQKKAQSSDQATSEAK